MVSEESRSGKDDDMGGRDCLHAVIVPLPSQGHITPAMQLAKKLVGLGFRITFVNTTHTHERMKKSRSMGSVEPEKGIEFVSVSDGLPDDTPRLGSKFREFSEALSTMGPEFEELFVTLQRKSQITCVIYDIRFTAVHGVSKKLSIPVVGFATPSAISLQCIFSAPALLSAGILPVPPQSTQSLHPLIKIPLHPLIKIPLRPPWSEEEAAARQVAPLADCVPGASPSLRVVDIPTYLLTHDLDHWFFQLHCEIPSRLLPDCECLLFNTFHEMEGEVLDAMRGRMNTNIFGIGPLVLNESEGVAIAGAGSALRVEDPVALSWLNDREPNSVVFVSFGSITTISVEQMQEFALGLEMSGHAFLWVIRSDTIENMCDENRAFETMFSEFVTRTRDRALLATWVPQTAVLSHPAVGAFVTHCGWNSITESVVSGVPMLGWPRLGDQTTNCHYITHVWKIGLDLQGRVETRSAHDCSLVSKDEVDRKVRKLMVEEGVDLEVDHIRIRSRKLGLAARKAVANGGSSQVALAKFVELVESWRVKQHALLA